jgi:hypothetical protein
MSKVYVGYWIAKAVCESSIEAIYERKGRDIYDNGGIKRKRIVREL